MEEETSKWQKLAEEQELFIDRLSKEIDRLEKIVGLQDDKINLLLQKIEQMEAWIEDHKS